MATTFDVFTPTKLLEATPTGQYTLAPVAVGTVKAILDAATVVNVGNTMAYLSLWIGETAATATRLAVDIPVGPGDPAYPCPELTGQVLTESTTVWAQASVASTLTFRLSGRYIME
jgi:hypothetical protein